MCARAQDLICGDAVMLAIIGRNKGREGQGGWYGDREEGRQKQGGQSVRGCVGEAWSDVWGDV